jgi:GNAT superfamily N-acetyltransferase
MTTTRRTDDRRPVLEAPARRDELVARVSALRRRVTEQAADRVERSRWGEAVLTPTLPRVWDLNFIRVARVPRLAPGRRLAREAEHVLGGAGLRHRKVVCEDPGLGPRLARALAPIGWRTQTLLVMTWRGPAPPATGAADVGPATLSELGAAYRWSASTVPDADPETIEQLVAETARTRPAVRLAARADGQPASFCRVFADGATAEIDDVGTLPEHRGRGLARAVVLTGVRWAVTSGHDLVFLRADSRDWPHEFYSRLGFAPLTRHYELIRR